jgi:hypothetical protein
VRNVGQKTDTQLPIVNGISENEHAETAAGTREEGFSDAELHADDEQTGRRGVDGEDTCYIAVKAEEGDHAEELELDPTVDAEALAQSVNAARVEGAVEGPSEEQMKAACTIQAMYRRHLQRARERSKSTFSEIRSRLFHMLQFIGLILPMFSRGLRINPTLNIKGPKD